MRQAKRLAKREAAIFIPGLGIHTPKNEIEEIFYEAQFKLGKAGNHWNGYKSNTDDSHRVADGTYDW